MAVPGELFRVMTHGPQSKWHPYLPVWLLKTVEFVDTMSDFYSLECYL